MENNALAKKMNVYAAIISAVVLLLVATMRKIPRLDFGIDFSFLPAVYSIMNLSAAVFLVLALYYIRQKKVEQHRQMIYVALTMSTLFLLMYVLYHLTSLEEIKYCGVGAIRYVYFFLLITHIVLAAVSFPFILFTFVRGYTMQIEKHKKMARWVYWVWLYVSISGPIVYLMLRPCMN